MKKILVFTLLLGIIGGILFKGYNNEKNRKNHYNVSVNVRSGHISELFQKLNLDKSLFFKVFLKLEHNSGRNIKTGFYEFNGEYSYADIMNLLESGKAKFKVLTVPEGYSIMEIGRLLESKGYGTEQGLRDALAKIKNFPYPTPNGNFEGYLYPETYYLSLNPTEDEIVRAMLNEFLKKFPPEKYPDKQKFYNDLILASIIQKEVKIDDEKPLISSVFHNRLDKNMTLSSCVTINYIYGYTKRKIYYKDLEVDSPYNTYKHKGLPPGPISNPDYESIMAAMNPTPSEYLFFVATGGGHHTFSKTYEEHLEAQKNGGDTGVHKDEQGEEVSNSKENNFGSNSAVKQQQVEVSEPVVPEYNTQEKKVDSTNGQTQELREPVIPEVN